MNTIHYNENTILLQEAPLLTTLINLFGRSPFSPLQSHMDQVSTCILMLPSLFEAMEKNDQEVIQQLAKKISKNEHRADLIKNDIRNHLPKSLFLPVDRGNLLEILTTQDSLADIAEDIAILITFKELTIPALFRDDFFQFLDKNIASFEEVFNIIKEMNELLETSFGGIEAEKVCAMVDSVALREHEADVIQRQLLKKLFSLDDQISYGSFSLWQKIIEGIAAISNLSERLANRIRMTLELK